MGLIVVLAKQVGLLVGEQVGLMVKGGKAGGASGC